MPWRVLGSDARRLATTAARRRNWLADVDERPAERRRLPLKSASEARERRRPPIVRLGIAFQNARDGVDAPPPDADGTKLARHDDDQSPMRFQDASNVVQHRGLVDVSGREGRHDGIRRAGSEWH